MYSVCVAYMCVHIVIQAEYVSGPVLQIQDPAIVPQLICTTHIHQHSIYTHHML